MHFVQRAIRKVRRIIKKFFRLRKARREGLVFVEPNFIYLPQLSEDSVVIDAGCGYEADFSLYMIKQHGVKSFAVDPTRKHRKALSVLEEKYKGHFLHLPFAISAVDGTLTFHESKVNESGSILEDHINVRQDETISYEVEAVSIKSLLKRIDAVQVDILKLDLEGAEYDLLKAIQEEELLPFKQIFVEFHHHAFSHISEAETQRIVKRISKCGFNSFSLDDHNYLFRLVD